MTRTRAPPICFCSNKFVSNPPLDVYDVLAVCPTPGNVVRYSQCPALLSLVALGVVLTDISRALDRLNWSGKTRELVVLAPCAAFAATGLWQLSMRGREVLHNDVYLFAIVILFVGCVAVGMVKLSVIKMRGALVVVMTTMLVGSVSSSIWLGQRWHSRYAATFDRQFTTQLFTRLQKNATRSKIAVIDDRYYPFFGSRRQFRAHRPFRITTRESLRAYLTENQIDLLAVIRNDYFKYGRYREVDEWVRGEPAKFEKIERGASFDVYRVLRGQPRVGGGWGGAIARPWLTEAGASLRLDANH